MSHSTKFCRSHVSLYCTLVLFSKPPLTGTLAFPSEGLPVVLMLLRCTEMTQVSDQKARAVTCIAFLLAKLPDFQDRIAPEKALPTLRILQECSLHYLQDIIWFLAITNFGPSGGGHCSPFGINERLNEHSSAK